MNVSLTYIFIEITSINLNQNFHCNWSVLRLKSSLSIVKVWSERILSCFKNDFPISRSQLFMRQKKSLTVLIFLGKLKSKSRLKQLKIWSTTMNV